MESCFSSFKAHFIVTYQNPVCHWHKYCRSCEKKNIPFRSKWALVMDTLYWVYLNVQYLETELRFKWQVAHIWN